MPHRCVKKLPQPTSLSGPVYDNGWLYFVDITGQCIRKICTESLASETFQLDEMVGCFSLYADHPNRLIVAKTTSIVEYDLNEMKEKVCACGYCRGVEMASLVPTIWEP